MQNSNTPFEESKDDTFGSELFQTEKMYEGSKNFWRTGRAILTSIVEYPALSSIEVIAVDAVSGCFAPQLYVNSEKLYACLDMKEAKLYAKQNHQDLKSKNKWGIVPEESTLLAQCTKEFAVQFILSRLEIDFSSGAFKVRLVPQTNDRVNGDRLDLEESRPAKLPKHASGLHLQQIKK
jgi:hypothetical protein